MILTHACGHVAYFDGDPDAYRAYLAAEQADKCARCRALLRYRDALAQPVPEMKGSDKQRPWATRIRESQLGKITAYLRTQTPAEAALLIIPALTLRQRTDAHWWIDHRSEEPALLLARIELEYVQRFMHEKADTEFDSASHDTRIPEGQCILCGAPVLATETYEDCTQCGYRLYYNT